MTFGPECPIPILLWKKYVDDVISIVKKNQLNTFFNHTSSVNPHRRITMESPDTDHSILFLDTKCLFNKDQSIQTSVYRKPTHTDWYFDWNSNHPLSTKNQ